MNVGTLRAALAELPDDVEVVIDSGLPPDIWTDLKVRWQAQTFRLMVEMMIQGQDTSSLETMEGPYQTLNRSGKQNEILFLDISDLDTETNSIALEL